MGNRAVLTSSRTYDDPKGLGIYLHWNGGLESVLAFLEVAKLRGYRPPKWDPDYARARLVGVIHEYFYSGGGDGHKLLWNSCSVGVGLLTTLDRDNGDNGTYGLGDDWSVKQRWFTEDKRTTVAELNTLEKAQYQAIIDDLLNPLRLTWADKRKES